MKNNFYDYVLEQLNLKLQLYEEKREEIDDEKEHTEYWYDGLKHTTTVVVRPERYDVSARMTISEKTEKIEVVKNRRKS